MGGGVGGISLSKKVGEGFSNFKGNNSIWGREFQI